MTLTILIASAVGTTVPCIVLWVLDERERLRSRPT
jgi:hypothetical protein